MVGGLCLDAWWLDGADHVITVQYVRGAATVHVSRKVEFESYGIWLASNGSRRLIPWHRVFDVVDSPSGEEVGVSGDEAAVRRWVLNRMGYSEAEFEWEPGTSPISPWVFRRKADGARFEVKLTASVRPLLGTSPK